MLSYQQAFYHSRLELEKIYDAHEATAIAHELLEHITGKNKLQRITEKETLLDKIQEEEFHKGIERLLQGEPLQYVTGIQWFMNKPFHVNKHVLIPRPETEELAQWIIDEWSDKKNIALLDIGTGSGCIPISLKLQLPNARITSIDISEDALKIAKRNADELKADITLLHRNFLNESNWQSIDTYNVIVSNPPYIPISEKDSLDKNVREYEPETALFVPDNDALLFYRKIALLGKEHLNEKGAIYCEVHKDYAEQTKELFENSGYVSELRKDMHGNERMVKAMKTQF